MIKKYSYQFEGIDDVVVEYTDGYVFLRERNNIKIYTAHDTALTLVSVTVAGKSINFNYDLSKPITFDITPYYAKGATSIAVAVKHNDITDTFTIQISVTTYDGYSPFKELALPEPCCRTSYPRITPPNRMLWDGASKEVTSIFAAMRGATKTKWSVNGEVVDNDIVFQSANIGADGFLAEFKSGDYVIDTIKRSVEEVDRTREYVYMRWKTPWGYYVEHLFYLDTYGADNNNAKELESILNYAERSEYVRNGSIYLDGITAPYDLFYYKTLEVAEVVEIWTPRFNISPSSYMPDGTAYEAVKIKGSNVKDSVVDGITQSTITLDFELL